MMIVSGGQTGIDRMGLEVAKELNIKTGGFAPKGWRTENGSDPTLKDYGLKEAFYAEYNYRTELNVKLSDATILFGDVLSAGSKKTIQYIRDHSKPSLINPTVQQIKEFIKEKQIINIAGNRGSKLTPDQLYTYRQILTEGLKP